MTAPRPNRLKARLKNNETCFGVVMRLYSLEIVEMAAIAGCDFVVVDLEHEPLDLADAAAMIRTAALAGMTPIARIGRAWLHHVDPLLAAGAQGFSLARVQSAADITTLADAVLYHPHGKRTIYALSSSGHYGHETDEAEWSAAASAEIMITAIIEEAAALDDIDAIIAHPHLDVIEFGQKDLRHSLGMGKSVEEVRSIARQIFAQAAEAGKATSHSVLGHITTPERTTGLSHGSGTLLISSPSDMVMSSLAEMMKVVRGETA
ncbi:MAG: HpcH/HpaI aldolase family protein [Hyphomicrobiaceae bacterium]